MWLGVDYYPEQWDASLMDADMDTILEMGGNVIRIGEFSWHLMEKSEGQFDFSFFDRVIAKAKEKGLAVIMGTPTATIPAWLAKKHPDIVSEFENGRKRTFGGRHVYCFNSPHMYTYSEKIIRALAEHYKDEKTIVAWQIDNELGHEGSDVCYCEHCLNAFRKFLSNRFKGDIDVLNDTYGTTFWSQEYNTFDEIPLPMETITTHNPALRMDWERFRNKSIVDFSNFQVDLLHEIIPDAVVMHDFPGGGLGKHCDYSEIAKKLDQVAYNNYPVWGGQKVPILPHEIAANLSYIYGLKGENFWITEAIMGAQGHDVTGFLPRPNQAKLWSYQGLARGCDSMMYFRYRGATKGAEQFCYGVLDADNIKRRKFYEVQSLFADAKKHEAIFSTPIRSDVAIVYDYASLAAFRIQRQSILLDCPAEIAAYYKPFFEENVSADIIPSDRDFSQYKVILLPQMIVTRESVRKRVEEFVANGGTAILTYRCAIKNDDNNLEFGKVIPLDYDKLTGVTVVETESLQDRNAFPLKGCGVCEGKAGYGGIFRDMIETDGAEVLYRYGDQFYEDFAAVTRKPFGKGMCYYLGCGMDEATLQSLINGILDDSQIARTASPEGVEVVVRGDAQKKAVIVMNHNDYETEFDGEKLAPFQCIIKEA